MHEFNCSVCVADMKNERMKLITKELGKELELKVECNFTQEANIESAVQKIVDKFWPVQIFLACSNSMAINYIHLKKSLHQILSKSIHNEFLWLCIYGKVCCSFHVENKAFNDLDRKKSSFFVSNVAAEKGKRRQVANDGSKRPIK